MKAFSRYVTSAQHTEIASARSQLAEIRVRESLRRCKGAEQRGMEPGRRAVKRTPDPRREWARVIIKATIQGPYHLYLGP